MDAMLKASKKREDPFRDSFRNQPPQFSRKSTSAPVLLPIPDGSVDTPVVDNPAYATLERYREKARLADCTVEALKAYIANLRQELEFATRALEKNKAEAKDAYNAVAKQEVIVAKLTSPQPQVERNECGHIPNPKKAAKRRRQFMNNAIEKKHPEPAVEKLGERNEQWLEENKWAMEDQRTEKRQRQDDSVGWKL